jgi:hypothetical protein
MNSLPLTIELIIDNTPNLSFLRANNHLLDRYREEFATISDNSHKEILLEEVWRNTYQAKLIKNDKNYYKIQFDNPVAMSMFLLQWS